MCLRCVETAKFAVVLFGRHELLTHVGRGRLLGVKVNAETHHVVQSGAHQWIALDRVLKIVNTVLMKLKHRVKKKHTSKQTHDEKEWRCKARPLRSSLRCFSVVI